MDIRSRIIDFRDFIQDNIQYLFPSYIYTYAKFSSEVLLLCVTSYLAHVSLSASFSASSFILLLWGIPTLAYTISLYYTNTPFDQLETNLDLVTLYTWVITVVFVITFILYGSIKSIVYTAVYYDIFFYIPLVIFTLRLYNLYSLYESDYMFYIDVGSQLEETWILASRSLQKSVKIFETSGDSRLKAMYGLIWTSIALSRYKILEAKIDNTTKFTYLGAERYSRAVKILAKIYLETIFSSPNSRPPTHTELYAKFNETINEADELLEKRNCHSCGDVYIKDEMYYIQFEDSDTIYCESCYNVYKNGKARSKRQKQSYQNRSKQKSTNHTQTENKTDDTMTKKEAYNVLNANKSDSNDEIKQSYREVVKEVHPDTPSGSEDEFKKVQEAKELLLE